MAEAKQNAGREGRRVTSVDVAREAGLSRATVSYVLNKDPRQTIPDATRQRVFDAAARLGYRPNGPARLLRGAKSSTVLMFTPGLERATDFVAAGIITKLGIALATHGLHLVWQLGEADETGQSVDLAPIVVLSSAADGDPTYVGLKEHFFVPVLTAFPGLDEFIASGSVAQVEYLAAQGRRDLLYVAPARAELERVSRVRWEAVLSTSEKLGLQTPRLMTLSAERSDAAEQLRTLLVQNPSIDGVCAFNDEVAFAILAAANDNDIAVPRRLAVIGIDNHPFGPIAIPALTTVESDVQEFVDAFAESVDRIGRGEDPLDVVLPHRAQPVIRASA